MHFLRTLTMTNSIAENQKGNWLIVSDSLVIIYHVTFHAYSVKPLNSHKPLIFHH